MEPKLFSSYLPNVLPQVVACLYACRFYASYLQYTAPEETNICFVFQMTEEDLAAQMEADRLLQATLRAQVRQILFLKIQNILASL